MRAHLGETRVERSASVPIIERLPALRAAQEAVRRPRSTVLRWLAAVTDTSGYLARIAWLCIYPLLAFAGGVVMLGFVAQTREFYAQFASPVAFAGMRASHGWLFAISVLLWAAALWYACRVLLARRYPADAAVPEPLAPFAARVRTWMPRVLGYFGLLVAACMLATYAPGQPSTDGLVALCVLHLAVHALLGSLLQLPAAFRLPVLACTAAVALTGYSIAGDFRFAALQAASALAALLIVATAGALLASHRLAYRIALAVVALGALLAFGRATGIDGRLVAAGVAVAASGFFVVVTERRRWFAPCFEGVEGSAADAAFQHASLPFGTRVVLGTALAVFAAAVLGFYFAPHALGALFGALAIVFIGFAVWMLGGVLVFVHWPKAHGLPSLAPAPLILAAVLSTYADNHALFGTRYRSGPDARADLAADFARWRRARIEEGDAADAPVIFVAAAGGGLRAATWTARALAAADEATCGAFGRRVYAISGVSGGSLGAATYVALKADAQSPNRSKAPGVPCKPGRAVAPATGDPVPGPLDRESTPGPLGRAVEAVLGRDFLAPVVGSFLFTDAFQRWIPAPLIVRDRGWVLAEHWQDAWREVQGSDRFRAPLPALYADDAQRRLPQLFLNATSVDTGRRAIASAVRIDAPDTIDLYADGLKTDGLPLAHAVLNSARFTYVSPAGTLIGRRDRDEGVADRLVDGGYFDNSGAETVLDAIAALTRAGLLVPGQAHVVLISNDTAIPRLCRDREPVRRDVSVGRIAAHTPASSETLAPVMTMLSTRVARALLAMERVVRTLGCDRIIEWGMYADRYPGGSAEGEREPALGWFLSQNSVRLIGTLARDYADALPFALAGCAPKPQARATLTALPPARCG